jgi:hypothetical protein
LPEPFQNAVADLFFIIDYLKIIVIVPIATGIILQVQLNVFQDHYIQ